uniref:tRNA(Ile)-lysidine synthase n=1 Tax=Erythrolobus coxiae TaxID=362235 RepID=UPI001FCDCAC9|nr:tRNA(Ile)-lysidine synthase [Erythrolobus coxiae]UNJ17788.1 tRNA(Ile)-lysidine synthase [Erythrolobus coxiae]
MCNILIWIEEHENVAIDKILVSISGGQDSMCLLKLLYDFSQEYKKRIAIVHFDHNWRADSSSNAKYYCFTYSKAIFSEEQARKWRYFSLNLLATQLNCYTIVTGHTLTDRIETLFYSLIRGSGLDGITSMAFSRLDNNQVRVIHPLNNLKRQELYWLIRKTQLPVWTDLTNYSNNFTRNKIRNELIPYIKTTFNSELEKNLYGLFSIMDFEVEYLQLKACFFYTLLIHPQKYAINRKLLYTLHIALQRRIVKVFLKKYFSNSLPKKIIADILLKPITYSGIVYTYKKYNVYLGSTWIYLTIDK